MMFGMCVLLFDKSVPLICLCSCASAGLVVVFILIVLFPLSVGVYFHVGVVSIN